MYEPIDPHDHGWLQRESDTRIYWEESGNPAGRPALYLHGGPGSGLGSGAYRQRFDPVAYRIIGLDQRGCGRSTPAACDDLAGLDTNTTQAMIGDLEALRRSLEIDSWIVHGVSWGSTLALGYAIEHPAVIDGLVLTAVTSGSRREIDWITEGISALFPEAHERFAAPVGDGERPVAAYARLLRHPDSEVRAGAASAWEAWEDTLLSLDPDGPPSSSRFADDHQRRNFATLVSHYWSNDCFLTGAATIAAGVSRLAGVPGVLIHGRRDHGSPVVTAWQLHRAWPGSELIIVEDEGHGGTKEMQLTADALDSMARSA